MDSLKKKEDIVKRDIWKKLKKTASKIPFVSDVVALYFCAIDNRTPLHAKVTAFSALAYFISPVDGVLDSIPLIGYGDDAGAIALAIGSMERHLTDEHREKANTWLEGNS